MHRLSITEMIKRIEREEIFHAVADDNSFEIKIEDYVPFACAAVHDGHQFRKDLWDKVLHSNYERWFEEDPATAEMISGLPITIVGRDSRFEYDLNREPSKAVYETAWGKELWKQPLTDEEREKSLEKHDNFYRVVLALVLKLEEMFGSVVFYDLHSYNYRRWEREVPVFNIGTQAINAQKFQTAIQQWQEILNKFALPIDQEVKCEVNDVFDGMGWFCRYVTKNSLNTLVLPTEVSKIYGDELAYQIYPEVVYALKDQFKYYIQAHAHRFYDRHHTED